MNKRHIRINKIGMLRLLLVFGSKGDCCEILKQDKTPIDVCKFVYTYRNKF